MRMFGMCFNWKVLAGLAAVGVALFVFASPSLALAALPFLLLAACPLSMIFMMAAMRKNGEQENAACAVGDQADKRKVDPEGQLAQLKAQQEAVASQIAELEEADGSRGYSVNRSGNAV